MQFTYKAKLLRSMLRPDVNYTTDHDQNNLEDLIYFKGFVMHGWLGLRSSMPMHFRGDLGVKFHLLSLEEKFLLLFSTYTLSPNNLKQFIML